MSHTRGLWFESQANTDGKYLSKNMYFLCSSLFPHTSVQEFDVSQAVEVIEINTILETKFTRQYILLLGFYNRTASAIEMRNFL